MSKISKAEELKERIAELELLNRQERDNLKKHLHDIRNSLKPANIIKNTVKEVAVSPGIQTKFIGALLGLAAGYLAKKAVFGKTSNPLKKIAGNLMQMGVAGTVSQNTDSLRTLGGDLIKRIFHRKKTKQDALNNGKIKQPL
jgi:hypothetical protein